MLCVGKIVYGKTMVKKKEKNNFKTLCLLILVLIIALLIYIGTMLLGCYRDVTELENNFYNNVKATSDFHNSSGRLSSFAGQFAMTKQPQFMDMYFEELDSKNREDAVHTLKNADEGLHASKASELCVKLMDTEFHVMKLVVLSTGIDENTVRSEISGYILPPDEQHMDPIEMLNRARSLINGNEYLILKSDADKEIGLIVGILVEQANEDIKEEHDDLTFFILSEIALGVTLVVFFALIFLHNSRTVDKPLAELRECAAKGSLANEEKGDLTGQALARAYNRNITEIKQLRKKVNLYQNAILMDAVSVANINMTTGEFVDISMENEEAFLSKFMKQIGVELPCDYMEYLKKALPYIAEENQEEFAQASPDTLISLYANGQKYYSGNVMFILEDKDYFFKVDSIMSKDPVSSEIMSMLIFRKIK